MRHLSCYIFSLLLFVSSLPAHSVLYFGSFSGVVTSNFFETENPMPSQFSFNTIQSAFAPGDYVGQPITGKFWYQSIALLDEDERPAAGYYDRDNWFHIEYTIGDVTEGPWQLVDRRIPSADERVGVSTQLQINDKDHPEADESTYRDAYSVHVGAVVINGDWPGPYPYEDSTTGFYKAEFDSGIGLSSDVLNFIEGESIEQQFVLEQAGLGSGGISLYDYVRYTTYGEFEYRGVIYRIPHDEFIGLNSMRLEFEINAISLSATTVPVPAAFYLFTSAVLLLGIKVRKKV